MAYPVSPRGGRQTWRPYIINKITSIVGPLAYCLVNHDGEFCLGRPPSLLPVSITTGSFVWAGPLAYCQSITTGSFVWAGPLAYCQCQSRRGVLFGQAP
ncbi:hypothetical protein J6590_102806 [Homalodisca vitripennis]|nr:hypothetical protein J6590_102806 [Homalodisca vitripennis]